jgi:hypothetical protein
VKKRSWVAVTVEDDQPAKVGLTLTVDKGGTGEATDTVGEFWILGGVMTTSQWNGLVAVVLHQLAWVVGAHALVEPLDSPFPE